MTAQIARALWAAIDWLIAVLLVLLPIAICILALMIGATTWAAEKAHERAECYRHAQAVEQCAQPGAVEAFIRRMLA